MNDLRCLFGWHNFADSKSPAITDTTGLKLECTRCQKTRVFRVGPPSMPPAKMPTVTDVPPPYPGG
jgi:hypothetical protein